jgi:hypothetical protein
MPEAVRNYGTTPSAPVQGYAPLLRFYIHHIKLTLDSLGYVVYTITRTCCGAVATLGAGEELSGVGGSLRKRAQPYKRVYWRNLLN